MSECPVRPAAVAAATIAFVECLEASGRLWPRQQRDMPDAEHSRDDLLLHFIQLEAQLNPGRHPYEDRRRVADVLTWAREADDSFTLALPKWKEDPAALPL